MMILNELANNDYGIANLSINVSSLVGGNEFVTISELLQKYKEGLIEKRSKGYDISLSQNSNGAENNDFVDAIELIQETYAQKNEIGMEFNPEESIRKI